MTARRFAPAIAAAVAVLATLSVARPARAEIVERVVAVVNDEAIFLSDLRRRAVPFLEQAFSAPTEVERMARVEQLYRQLLDQLVDEELIQQAARRMQVRVTSDDVDRAIRNVQRQSGLEEREFWDAVRGQGFTEAQYRSDVRRQLLRLKVLNQRVRGRVNITEQDVRRKYDEMARGAQQSSVCYRVAMVFFPIAEGASETDVAAVRADAQETRRTVTPDTFEQAMTTHGGGDLGRVCQGELAGDLERAIVGLEDGGISDVVRGPSGFHIFLLQQRERSASNVPSYEEARDTIYRQLLEQAMGRQERQFLDELRREAVVTRRL